MTIKASHVFPGAVVYENPNYGYPFVGSARRKVAPIIGVSHITGNWQLPSALAEVKYAARDGSGASFHFCVNRNGTVVQAIDPFLFASWTNGDINRPDVSNPYIAQMVGSAYNPNEFTLVCIENVGFENALGSPSPLTDAQVETNAQIYAWAAHIRGLTTVHIDRVIGHRMINSVTRQHCPTWGDLTALRRRIQQRANEILAAKYNAVEEDPEVIANLEAQLREANEKLKARWAWITKLRAKVDALEAALAEAQAALDAAEENEAELSEARATVRRLRTRLTEVKQIIADAAVEAGEA